MNLNIPPPPPPHIKALVSAEEFKLNTKKEGIFLKCKIFRQLKSQREVHVCKVYTKLRDDKKKRPRRSQFQGILIRSGCRQTKLFVLKYRAEMTMYVELNNDQRSEIQE